MPKTGFVLSLVSFAQTWTGTQLLSWLHSSFSWVLFLSFFHISHLPPPFVSLERQNIFLGAPEKSCMRCMRLWKLSLGVEFQVECCFFFKNLKDFCCFLASIMLWRSRKTFWFFIFSMGPVLFLFFPLEACRILFDFTFINSTICLSMGVGFFDSSLCKSNNIFFHLPEDINDNILF